MLACGFNLGDAGAGAEAELLIREFPVVGFGELTLQSDDVNNMTIKGGNWTFSDPSVRALLDVAASQDVSHMEAENPSRASDVARKGSALPFVFVSDARSISTKPYRGDFEYIDTIEMVCAHDRRVPCLWIAAGTFARGQWAGYNKVLHALLMENPNLYISLTPELVSGKFPGLSREDMHQLVAEMPTRIVLGTTVRGLFQNPPPAAFGEMDYKMQVDALNKFAAEVEEKLGHGIAAGLRYRNATELFNLPLPNDPAAEAAMSRARRCQRRCDEEAAASDDPSREPQEPRYDGGGGDDRGGRAEAAKGLVCGWVWSKWGWAAGTPVAEKRLSGGGVA